MKNRIVYMFIFAFAISCKSQTISLETAAQCIKNPNCPDYTYAKDINNSLGKYIGTWKGNFNGKIYELKFNKGLYSDLGIQRDILVGRIRIKDTNSLIFYDSFTELNDLKTEFGGLNFQPDLLAYRMYFSGSTPRGCINYGTVYLRIKPNLPNQMTILYWSDKDIVVGDCPSNFTQTFPEKQTITLIKQ